MSRALLFCSVFTAILATTCFAQVETLVPSSQGTATSGEPAAVFGRLRDYLVSKRLDFQTTFTAHSDTLGTLQNPVFPPDAFVFTPPKGSEKVDVGSLGLEPYL